jgi:hypothetical protein
MTAVSVRLSKLSSPLLGQKQGGGEAAVLVRQGDQHVVAARPDVQRVRSHSVAPFRVRRYGQFLVAMLEIGLVRFDQLQRTHAPAHQGAGAIARQQWLHGYADQAVVTEIADECDLAVEVGRLESMFEMNTHSRLLRGEFDQGLIEPMPRNGVNQLVRALSVGLSEGCPSTG